MNAESSGIHERREQDGLKMAAEFHAPKKGCGVGGQAKAFLRFWIGRAELDPASDAHVIQDLEQPVGLGAAECQLPSAARADEKIPLHTPRPQPRTRRRRRRD